MKLRVISFFSGAGFADYALHRASEQTGIPVEIVLAVDSDPKCVAVYNANLPSRAVVADVKAMTRADLPAHDLVIGGPPCQSHSTAGPKDCHCHIGGPASPRCCLADFQRLAVGSAFLMENVRSRLVNAPWSEQLCALDFGDVTTRKRWFYSDHLLHVMRTPGPRRLRDIRDHDADRSHIDRSHYGARRFGKRFAIDDADVLGSVTGNMENAGGATMIAVNAADDDGARASLTASAHHRSRHADPAKARGAAHLVTVRDGAGARRAISDEEALGSVTSDSWHGTNQGGPSMVAVGMRSSGNAADGRTATVFPGDGALGSVTSHTHHQPLRVGQTKPTKDDEAIGSLTAGKGGVSGFVLVEVQPGKNPLFAWPPTSLGLHMNGGRDATVANDDDVLPSILAQQWHGVNPALGVRCPSLLEMARAHSIPDDWDWAGATKTRRGRMIANGWPIGLGTAVLAAMLRAVAASLERAA